MLSSPYKTFNGKKYELYSFFTSKSKAEYAKKSIKNMGYNSRITKNNNTYYVWLFNPNTKPVHGYYHIENGKRKFKLY